MSGSYWTSTQRLRWQYSKAALARQRQELWVLQCQLFPQGLNIVVNSRQNRELTNNKDTNSTSQQLQSTLTVKNIPITHRDLHYDKDFNLRIYCYFLIMKLGRRLNIRQYALATAHVYLSRFLLKASVREVNLYLLVTTCVYLACKVEECPQYIRTLVSEARSLWPEFIPPDPTKVTEFEFYLLEELQCYLIVHHPYEAMEQIIEVLKTSDYNLTLSNEDIQNCWSLINDSYINDVHLIYPPHIIAMACMFITISLQNTNNDNNSNINSFMKNGTNITNILSSDNLTPAQEKFNKFMAESQVDLLEVLDTIQQQITLYDHWDKYHEPWIKFLLHTLYLRPVINQWSKSNNSNSSSDSDNNIPNSYSNLNFNPISNNNGNNSNNDNNKKNRQFIKNNQGNNDSFDKPYINNNTAFNPNTNNNKDSGGGNIVNNANNIML